VHFKVKKTTTMSKASLGLLCLLSASSRGRLLTCCAARWEVKQIMNAFCQRKSYSPNQVRFLFEGSRVNGEQTPNDLEMEEGDIIVRRLLRFLGALPVHCCGSHNSHITRAGRAHGASGRRTSFSSAVLGLPERMQQRRESRRSAPAQREARSSENTSAG
jgi:hypothetical protein